MDIVNLSQSVVSDLIAALIVAGLGAIAAKIGYTRAVGLAKSGLPIFLVFITVAISAFAVSQAVNYFYKQTKEGRLETAIQNMVAKDYPLQFRDGWTIEVKQLEPRMILNFVYPDSIEAHQLPHKLNNEEVMNKVYDIVIRQGFKNVPLWGFTLHTFTQDERNKLMEHKP